MTLKYAFPFSQLLFHLVSARSSERVAWCRPPGDPRHVKKRERVRARYPLGDEESCATWFLLIATIHSEANWRIFLFFLVAISQRVQRFMREERCEKV